MRYAIVLALLICHLHTLSQDTSSAQKNIELPDKYLKRVNSKISDIDSDLSKKSKKYLRSLSKQEEEMKRKLSKIDSLQAAEIFANAQRKYEDLSKKMSNIKGKATKALSGEYLPYLDSMQGSLAFLKDAKNIVSKSKNIKQKLEGSLSQIKVLQSKLEAAGDVKQYLLQRQEQLKELLGNYANMPGDIKKYLGKYQQEVYYYSQQLQEYRHALNDPDKLVKKMLQTLQTFPQFQKFMSKYSMLAGIFAPIESAAVNNPLLQNRDQVMQTIQQQLGSSSSGSQQLLGQQMQQAQGELAKFKEKLSGMGISQGDNMNMPDFKPNQQKTKTFLKRIELGTNLQTQKATNYFPVSTDIAVTAGYKIDDSKIIGIGLSGKIGLGRDWKHIQLSGQGAGMRFFAEWKAKGKLWLTAGAETNYQRPVESLAVFKNFNTWNKSAVAGISRKYTVSKKLKGNMQLLYDFLHQRNTPPTPAFIWRVGYNF